MHNDETREVISKIIFILIGLIFGFLFFQIYFFYPNYRGILFIFTTLLFLIMALLFERVTYKTRFSNKIEMITSDIKSYSEGNEIIKPTLGVNKEINNLYSAIEELRRNLKRKHRLLQAVLDLENTLAVNIELNKLIDVLLPRLVEETDSNWGVFYTYNKMTDKLELEKSVGLSKNVYKEFDVEMGEGLIGIAAKTKGIHIKKNIPPDTAFENRTFLGKVIPKNIMTVPIFDKDELMAVIAFASIYDFNEDQVAVISLLGNYLGFTISNCMTYERTQRLTKELQFQNELIQNMNDELELKVSSRTDFLNSIIDSIKDYLIISVDKDGYVTTWNKGAEEIKGYTAEETIGNHITLFYETQEGKENVLQSYDLALKEGKFSEIGWCTRRDGTEYYADIVISPIFDKSGELQGYTNITKDITVTKNLEKKLIYEKAYNEKIIESSKRALLFTDKDGIIINANKMAVDFLVPEGIDIIGKGIYEFFVDKDILEKNIISICSASGRGESVGELLYKHDEIKRLKIDASATNSEIDNKGVLIYLSAE